MKKNNIIFIMALLVIFSSLFLFQYHFDNKYTYDSPIGQNGVLDLRNESSPAMLTYGWELYNHKIINPEDIETTPCDYIIYIGENSSFHLQNNDNPHGYATFHLTVLLPSKPQNYAMEVPEIYSASRIYINQNLLWESGQIDPYQPSVRSGIIMFQAQDRIDITIQVADENHYYSGLVYPFLFGQQHDIVNLLNLKNMFRYIICTVAISIGLLTLTFSLKHSQNRYVFLLLSMFSLISGFYLSYPLIHMWGLPFLTYHIEDICYFLMIGFIVQLHCHICSLNKSVKMSMTLITCLFILAVLICPYFFYQNNTIMDIYSLTIDCYKAFLMGWFLVTALYQFQSQSFISHIWMSNVCIFIVALFMNVILPLFEPICSFYQIEIACIYILITTSICYIIHTLKQQQEKELLENHIDIMKKQFAMLQTHYQQIQANIQQSIEMNHDLRHHMIIIRDDIQNQNYQHLSEYVNNLYEYLPSKIYTKICLNYVFNATLSYYITLAKSKEISFSYQIDIPPQLNIPDWQLGIILGNLIENAFEATTHSEHPEVILEAYMKDKHFILKIKNSISASPIKEHFHHSAHGIGLLSVRHILESLQGNMTINHSLYSFEVIIIIWNQSDM